MALIYESMLSVDSERDFVVAAGAAVDILSRMATIVSVHIERCDYFVVTDHTVRRVSAARTSCVLFASVVSVNAGNSNYEDNYDRYRNEDG